MFHDLHPMAAILIQHPLRDQKLIATRKRHLYLVQSEGGTLRTTSPSRRNAGDADSESSTKHGQCVSALQKPDATHVAGFYTWNQLGRRVKKGEKGIRILAPIVGVKRQKEEAEEDVTRQNVPVLVGFRAAYVFEGLSTVICGRDSTRRWNARRTSGHPAMAAISIIAQFDCPVQRLLAMVISCHPFQNCAAICQTCRSLRE